MQTFLPYKDLRLSAKTLDNKRCFKQAVECIQILNVLGNSNRRGWVNHPAVRMWRGYESTLVTYLDYLLQEWKSRGYKSPKCDQHFKRLVLEFGVSSQLPHWLNDEFCKRHRSNLLRKDETFYRKYGWSEPTTLEYLWPI